MYYLFIYFVCTYVCVTWACTYHNMYVKVRGHILGLGSLLSPYVFLGWNLSSGIVVSNLFFTDPSQWPNNVY